jgi:hypothetical protein
MLLAGSLCSTLAAITLLVVSLGSGRWFVDGERSIGLRTVATCGGEPDDRSYSREPQECDGVRLSEPSRGGAWWTFWWGVLVVGLLMVIALSVVLSDSPRLGPVGCLAVFVLLFSGISVSTSGQVGFAFMTFLTGCISALLACVFAWPQSRRGAGCERRRSARSNGGRPMARVRLGWGAPPGRSMEG